MPLAEAHRTQQSLRYLEHYRKQTLRIRVNFYTYHLISTTDKENPPLQNQQIFRIFGQLPNLSSLSSNSPIPLLIKPLPEHLGCITCSADTAGSSKLMPQHHLVSEKGFQLLWRGKWQLPSSQAGRAPMGGNEFMTEIKIMQRFPSLCICDVPLPQLLEALRYLELDFFMLRNLIKNLELTPCNSLKI